MSAEHFDAGFAHGMSAEWCPPLDGDEARKDYQEGWRKGQQEFFRRLTCDCGAAFPNDAHTSNCASNSSLREEK